MTIIYSNFRDVDTSSMPLLWRNLPNANVVEITPDMIDVYEDIVDNAISQEEDTIIFCGHGTRNGLLFPDFSRGIYLLHENNINLIKARNIVGIWCYASSFASSYNLHGFFTSMFISNVNEAYDNGFYNASQDDINRISESFFARANELLISNEPVNQWQILIGCQVDLDDEIQTFNYQGLVNF